MNIVYRRHMQGRITQNREEKQHWNASDLSLQRALDRPQQLVWCLSVLLHR